MRIAAAVRRLFRRSAFVLPASVVDSVVRATGPIGGATVGPPAARAIAVLAPHPDDESLGCGGAIALASAAGAAVTVVFATDGDNLLVADEGANLAARRRNQAKAACLALGAQPAFLGFRDGALSGDVDGLAAALSTKLAEIRPDLVLLPWFGDRNDDHRALNDAFAKTAIAPDTTVWGFEVWTPLPANRLTDITGTIDVKRRAIAAHTADVLLDAEAFLGLNRYHAAMARLRGTHAEAYFETTAGDYVRHVRATAGA